VPTDGKSADAVQQQIESEREQLADAVKTLRSELHEATDVAAKLPPLPLLAAGALTAGFVLSGGIGATVRLIFRRGREGHTLARVGRLEVVDTD
jgi:hypothetical protein